MVFLYCILTIAFGVADAYYTGERFKKQRFFGELNGLLIKAFNKFGKAGVYVAIGAPTLAITGLCGYFDLESLMAFYAGMRSVIAFKQFLAFRKGV